MAYRIPNKNPIDVGSRVAIGVSIPFNSPQIFTQTYTTQEQIKSNIINYILTDRGTFSSGSHFTLAMRKVPHAVIMGDTTGGGMGLPNGGQLPNGWTYRFSVTSTRDLDGSNFD